MRFVEGRRGNGGDEERNNRKSKCDGAKDNFKFLVLSGLQEKRARTQSKEGGRGKPKEAGRYK